jgi:hypothetical protein
MAAPGPIADWTCARCEMKVSWAANVQHPKVPGTWIEQDGEFYCLCCRREMAAEAGLARAPEDASNAERSKIRSRALIEFEIQRDPTRNDGGIAKACRTSVVAVRKARTGLGMKAPTPA